MTQEHRRQRDLVLDRLAADLARIAAVTTEQTTAERATNERTVKVKEQNRSVLATYRKSAVRPKP